ncbi:MAG: DAK2 domain-containing protein [Anaerolineae bacterium]|nr:DAK2 domain-containing protein [Anaerolineae bacterium]
MADNAAVAQLCLDKALAAIEAAVDELGKLDAFAGDGDHGLGMARGFRAAAAAKATGTAGDVLAAAGAAFADAAGGASGALVGIWITSIGNALKSETINAAQVLAALEAGLAAMMRLGKAKVGDKTMIDTLDPFVRAFAEAVSQDAAVSIPAAWKAALPAAEKGMQSTVDMVSKRGRSSRLGERSRGGLDAGSVSMNYVLRAVGAALDEGCAA